MKLQVNGFAASQVVRLIVLSLVFASQKIVHNVRNEMAESIVPLRRLETSGQNKLYEYSAQNEHGFKEQVLIQVE